LAEFNRAENAGIVERLARRAIETHILNQEHQIRAWRKAIEILRPALGHLPARWRLLFEYPLLRLGRRLDVVLVAECAIFVFEFKIGAYAFDAAA